MLAITVSVILSSCEKDESNTAQGITPVVNSISPAENIKAGDLVTITGSNLAHVKQIRFGARYLLEKEYFVSLSNTQIELSLPPEAPNGEVYLIADSETAPNVSAGIITVILPAVTDISPLEITGGTKITITGTDLDLVKNVLIATVTLTDLQLVDNTTLRATCPNTIAGGFLKLVAKNDEEVPYTAKSFAGIIPVITGATPLTVVDNRTITITGQKLLAVEKVLIGDQELTGVTAVSNTELTATCPDGIETGVLKVITYNGETVTTDIKIEFPEHYCVIPDPPGTDEEFAAGAMLQVTVENSDKLTGVEINGSAAQYMLQGDVLYILIPDNASGATSLKLISLTGEITYTITVIGLGTTTTPIWTGVQDMGDWSGYIQLTDVSLFSAVKVGDIIKVTVDPSSVQSDAQASLKNGSWSEIAPGTEYFDITGDFTLEVTSEILTALQSGGLIVGGKNYIATQVSIISTGDGSETLWEGAQATGSWTGNVTLQADAFANAKVGNKIVVTCADVAGGAQWGIRDGNWTDIVSYADITGSSYEYTIDAAGLAALQATGGIFTGHDYSITKIELKK
jgi:hypothetical protein